MIKLGGSIACDHCGTPALRIVGQMLVIEHVHHGQKHTTVLTMAQIIDRMAQGSVPLP